MGFQVTDNWECTAVDAARHVADREGGNGKQQDLATVLSLISNSSGDPPAMSNDVQQMTVQDLA